MALPPVVGSASLAIAVLERFAGVFWGVVICSSSQGVVSLITAKIKLATS